MYALLELAERVKARGLGALDTVESSVELPDNEVRGIDRFVMGPVEDEWLYSEEFWHSYLQRLARNRFNRFVLVTGYDSAFMSPPYPFFLDVPGYDVEVDDAIDASQEEHLELLRTIGDLCHHYGLEFVFATWQQRPWSANPDLEYDPTDQGMVVTGLPDDSQAFTDYCATGLRDLLIACPEIDAIQLRVNFESGVGDRSTAEEFWREMILAVEKASDERDDDVELDLRAKGLTDTMIQWAQETGLDVTIPTKHWCESTGLPYHNTQMREDELANLDDMNKNRRYSYSDLLEKPHFYDMLYRLWVSGTNRVFLWGDPDFARRFADSTQFGGARGFEVTTPLSLKGGHFFLQKEKWELFDDPALRDYEWEDERYWAWYRLFGRLGYSEETDSDVWEREFERRFGDAAAAVLRAYRHASKFLPLLTAVHLTRHPALANWAELDTGGALFADHNYNDSLGDVTYATAEPSDPGLFYQIDEFVADYLAGEVGGKYTPLQVARWYRHIAAETHAAIDTAENDAPDTGEFRSTALDMRMLADLASYHADKTEAAIALKLYEETGEVTYLQRARSYADDFRDAWASLAERGEGTYHDNLLFGMGPESADEGNWTDRLVEMEADIEELDRLLESESTTTQNSTERLATALEMEPALPFEAPSLTLDVPDTHPAGEDLTLTLYTAEFDGFEDVQLRYRHTNQTEGAFRRVEMEKTDRGYRATIPGEYLTRKWDLLVYVSATDSVGNAVLHPGLYHTEESAPYYVITIS